MQNQIIKIPKSAYQIIGESLDCTPDTAFNVVLTDSESISAILSDILKLDKKYIKENIVFKNRKLTNNRVLEKQSNLDLLVEIKGTYIIVEMNRYPRSNVFIKNATYMEKISSTYLSRGESYQNKPVTILINIDRDYEDKNKVNGKFKKGDKVITEYVYMERTKHIEYKYINNVIYHVSLKKLLEKYNTLGYTELNESEKALMILQGNKYEVIDELSRGSEELKHMTNVIKDLENNEEFIGYYDKELVEKTLHEEDLEESRKEGIEQGFKDSNISFIKNLVDNNFDIETISKLTNLTIDEVNNYIDMINENK